MIKAWLNHKAWLGSGFAASKSSDLIGQCQWFGGKLNLEETSYMWSLPFGLPGPPLLRWRVRHWTAGWNIVVGGG